MDGLNKSLEEVSIGEPSKPSIFTFVPVVRKLPVESIITEEERSGVLTGKPKKNFAASHEETTGETMSDGEIFKAEKVFINNSVEGGAGNTVQPGTKLQTHKIKLSYKSLAAIPTNTLLLDQQAIDEQVEREESPCDMLDRGVADSRAEMCSPAQLRQQSEELYAVIDELLAIPATPRSLQSSRSSTPITGLQQNSSSFPKSLGRETKYASLCSLHPSTGVERNLMGPKKTKPGVIRPMTASPRLMVEDEEESHPNPFRQFNVKQTFTDNKKVENKSLEEAGKDSYTSSEGQRLRKEKKPERRPPFSVCDLQITEPEDQISHPVKEGTSSFSATEGRMEAFETHI